MKKGFTLVELLAVVIILSVVAVLVFPNVIEIINTSKQNLYNVQVADIELEAKNWALVNPSKLDKYHLNSTYLSLSTLKQEGFLETDDIENPINSEVLDGCIEIKYNLETSQFSYKFYETLCNDIDTVISDAHGIVYTYDNGKSETYEKNTLTPAGMEIYNYYSDNNLLNSIGGTTSGLYDLGEVYVFRGSSPNNYVKIGTETFRILSIDTDYNIRLIKTSSLTNNWSNTTDYKTFLDSNVSTALIEYLNNKSNSINKLINKVVDGNTLYVGKVKIEDFNYNVLKSVEETSVISNKIGLINPSDYVIASLNNDCYNNMNSSCSSDNYLADLFSNSNIWTMNPSESGALIISNKKITDYSLNGTNDITFKVYPVIKLSSNVYISGGSGISSNPYVLN